MILAIGIGLMPIGINWIFGLPVGPTAPMLVDPVQRAWLDRAITAGRVPEGVRLAPTVANPTYASRANMLIAVLVLGTILLMSRFAHVILANIGVLLGIAVGGIAAAAAGLMHFDKVGEAAWFAVLQPFDFGLLTFDPVMILTMVLVMIVVMIESTRMFLALSDIYRRPVGPRMASGSQIATASKSILSPSSESGSAPFVQPHLHPGQPAAIPVSAICSREAG